MRVLAATALLACAALPALAQPTNLRPTRDVTVTYRMSGMAGVPAQDMQMAFAPGSEKQRIDPPGGLGWLLVDRKAKSAVMVMDAQRAFMTMPAASVAAMTQEVPPGATFSRKGGSTVAGNTCTEWDIAAAGGKGVSCITDDGVLLRTVATAPNGAAVTMEATQVAYGTIDPARMTIPAGYSAMSMPAGAPGPSAAPSR